jgi:hypothetical protein
MKLMRTEQHVSLVVIFVFLLGASTTSCEETVSERTVPIEVNTIDVPKVGYANQELSIRVVVQGYGCTTNPRIVLKKLDENHYLIKGQARFAGSTRCPYVLVTKDSTLRLTLSVAGEYFFQANEAPFLVKRDTLLIN